MQDPSFSSNQKRLSEYCGESNFQAFLKKGEIPTPNQIRNVLDYIPPESFYRTDSGLKSPDKIFRNLFPIVKRHF